MPCINLFGGDQAYHNPYIIDVIHKLISGIEDIDRKDILSKISMILYEDQKSDLDDMEERSSSNRLSDERNRNNSDLSKIKSSSLYQLPIPENINNYEELFKYLGSKDMIPLGILRGVNPSSKMGPRYNKYPYVVTNPKKNTELYPFDKVFVLSPIPRHTPRTSQYLVRLIGLDWSCGVRVNNIESRVV